LIIWSAADELNARIASDNDHTICDSDNFWVFIGILIGYEALLLFASSILAVLTRNFGKFGEAKSIGFALYNLTLTAVIIVPIIFALDTEYFLQWLLGVMYVEFYFFSTFAILVIPKIYEILWVDRGKPVDEQRMLPDTGRMTNASKKNNSWFQSKGESTSSSN